MMYIPLTRGDITAIDDSGFGWLSKYRWYSKTSAYNVYACRSVHENGKVRTIRMHRKIMNCPPDKEVDHRNGDTLNNQRSNLEIVSKKENIWRKTKSLFRPNNHTTLNHL